MSVVDRKGRPLRPGDVVLVVAGHPCDIGLMYTVKSLRTAVRWRCHICGEDERIKSSPWVASNIVQDNAVFGSLAEWVERMDPNVKTERKETKKELTV